MKPRAQHALVAALILAVPPASRAGDEILSAASLPDGSGYPPGCAALADLDGDGETDLVAGMAVGFSFTDNLVLWRGLGRGQFTRWPGIDLFATIRDVAVRDFDEDGRLDIVAAGVSQTVSLSFTVPGRTWFVKGHGDGTFEPGIEYELLVDTPSLKAADFDTDGHQDLLGGTTQGVPQWAPGLGDGTFGTPVSLVASSLPLSMPFKLALADFDGDGHDDVARTILGGELPALSIWLGHGDGSFALPVDTPLPGTTVAEPAIGLLDGDALSDLVTATPNELLSLTSLGDGHFALHAQPLPGESPYFPYSVALGDFDGDDVRDVLIGSPQYILRGHGNGEFGEPVLEGTAPDGALLAPDLDGNGFSDALVLTGDLMVIPDDGQGGLRGGRTTQLPEIPLSVEAADFDGDGHQDLLTGGLLPQSVSLLVGQLDGSFSPSSSWPLAVSTLSDVVVGDLDGDGWPDALAAATELAAGQFSSVLMVLLDTPAGLQAQPDIALQGAVIDAELVDLDLDGALDIVAQSFSTATLHRGDGTGGFAAPETFASPGRTVHAGELTLDGLPDLVVGSNLLAGLGGGALAAPVKLTTDLLDLGYADSSQIADVSKDGLIDVVFSAQIDSLFPELRVLVAQGDGTFSVTSGGPDIGDGAVALADLDGDGLVDLVAGSDFGSYLGLGLGDGHMCAWRGHAGPTYIRDVDAADLDGDGLTDVLFAGAQSNGHGIISIASGGQAGPVSNIGAGQLGPHGVPFLDATTAPDSIRLRLANAPPSAPILLIAGLQPVMQPLAEFSLSLVSGTLVPHPDVVLAGLLSDAGGAMELKTRWPSGLPSGTRVFVQAWIAEELEPIDHVGSNGLMLAVD